MSDIRIEVFKGDYENENAYENVLDYIGEKTYLGGYGFTPNESCSIIQQFQLSEDYSTYRGPDPRKIWHFGITFLRPQNHTELLCLAEQISLVFFADYQVLYGLDTEKHGPHLHFGVNAFSYHPDTPILTKEKMRDYLITIQSIIFSQYPGQTVTLQFQRKKG